eukprot:TRINITY_DN5681_c0_g1_i2.p1 TRINITY_DN5681_c0_g1~~TRINITY_DN5681_c0_g1_i2.p1  ORF type:complete len:306 (+),score=65.93 TRINITY_DN5681_c0_g1_i2:52-918(+)
MGTGGYVSHAALALEMNGTLWVVEAASEGLISTPVDKWLAMEEAESQNPVSVLRLAKPYRDLYNNDKAIKRWKELEGLPYGVATFVYGWIDTIDQNIPYPLCPSIFPFVMSLMDSYIPGDYDDVFNTGINQRLGNFACCPRGDTCPSVHAECWDFNTTLSMITQQGKTILDILAVVEDDSWVYCTAGVCGPSRVCSALVTDLLQAAGVFGSTPLVVTEFVPRDVYQIGIWDNTKIPGCETLDPDLPQCQVQGHLKNYLPGFNGYPPYPHMNEHCGCMPYDYVRTPANC